MQELRVKIAGVVRESFVDGPGIRSTIFFQGCNHACPGCHNPETWDINQGLDLTFPELLKMLRINPLISGITFSGGEPFLQAEAASKLGAYFKSLNLDLWIYTGYTWDYLLQNRNQAGFNELIEITDVIVDGPFKIEERDLNLVFRGSSNQRLIKVRPSLEAGRIILWEPETVD